MYLAELQTICTEYWKKISRLEENKYDLEMIEKFKQFEVIRPSTKSFYFIFFSKIKIDAKFQKFFFV